MIKCYVFFSLLFFFCCIQNPVLFAVTRVGEIKGLFLLFLFILLLFFSFACCQVVCRQGASTQLLCQGYRTYWTEGIVIDLFSCGQKPVTTLWHLQFQCYAHAHEKTIRINKGHNIDSNTNMTTNYKNNKNSNNYLY